MATLFDAIETRLDAILIGGRSVGVDGAQKSIPADQFRRSLHNAPLEDPNYPAGAFDRAIDYDWSSIGDGEPNDTEPSNPRDPWALRTIVVAIQVGWIYGTKLEKDIIAIGSEVKLESARNAKKRALEECDRMTLALCEPDLFADNTTDPKLTECYRLGLSTVRPIGEGRLLSVTRFSIGILRNQQARYSP